jgi:hypothetical protein
MVWLVITTGTGAQNASDDEVAGWVDLFVPPVPKPDQGVIVHDIP